VFDHISTGIEQKITPMMMIKTGFSTNIVMGATCTNEGLGDEFQRQV
jgi:hypothetical protein